MSRLALKMDVPSALWLNLKFEDDDPWADIAVKKQQDAVKSDDESDLEEVSTRQSDF